MTIRDRVTSQIRFKPPRASGLAPASPPPTGTNGSSYTYELPEGTEDAPATWNVVAGALPGGVTLTGTTISGTPTSPGTFNATLTAGQTVDLTIVVDPRTPIVAAPDLTGFTDGDAVSVSFSASDGVAPYTYAVTGGALPGGLSLAANGTLSGTLSGAGTFNFTVTATGNDGGTGSTSVAMTVTPLPLTVTTVSLASGNVGDAYSASLAATGGVEPYTWSVVAGSLPAGVSLAADGTFSGTPTTEQTANFTVQVAGAGSMTDTQALSINVTNVSDLVDVSSLEALGPTRLWRPDPGTMNTAANGSGSIPGNGDAVGRWVDSVAGAVLQVQTAGTAPGSSITLDDIGVRFVGNQWMEELGSAGIYPYLHSNPDDVPGCCILWLREQAQYFQDYRVLNTFDVNAGPGFYVNQAGDGTFRAAAAGGSGASGSVGGNPADGALFALGADRTGSDGATGVTAREIRAWFNGVAGTPAIYLFSNTGGGNLELNRRATGLNPADTAINYTVVAIAFFDRNLSPAEFASAVPA